MKRTLKIFLTLTAAWFFGAAAYATDNAPPAAHPPVPDAKAILQKMAQQLAQAPGFSVTIRSDYDAIQQDGLSVAFGNRHQVFLQRPDKLRVEAARSDGDEDRLLFDGKTLTAYKSGDNVYAQLEKLGTVDNVVVYLVKDLQITVPLARILLTSLPQELESLANGFIYVEKDTLVGAPADHIIMRTADTDLQLWITQGEQPLLVKIIVTYKNAPGQPQFRATLSDWNLAPAFKPEIFIWTPPAGAEHIPFLAPVPQKIVEDAKQGVTP